MSNRISKLTTAFTLAVLTSACGFNSGLDGSTEVSALSAEDQKTLCEEQADYTERRVDEEALENFTCTFLGLVFGGLSNPDDPVAGCQASVDMCKASESDEEEEGGSCDDFTTMGCDITVAEYEACLEERVEQINEVASSVSCSSMEGDFDVTDGEACAAVAEKCPQLM